MTSLGGGGRSRWAGTLLLLVLAPCPAGCALMPRELNLSPLWFHRLDEQGDLLEMDLLWPIVHYEQTPTGGNDFRIRPLWRRISEPTAQTVEHQFLWPLGHAESDPEETHHRLFPLWSWRQRVDQDGKRDVDWYLLFPFVWGGANERRDEDYFAFLPFYADIPQFISYDRFRTVLFPLWVSLDKEGHHHDLLLWPFIGFSSCAEGGHSWFRILPFYGHDVEPGRHERRFVLWPILIWGTEDEDTDDPVWNIWVWPLIGLRRSHKVDGWSFIWPLFEKTDSKDSFYRLNLLWPFFHYYWVRWKDNATEWWLWPIVGHATSDHLDSWSFLWPLIWWRRYEDADGKSAQEWVLPLFWHVHQEHADGRREDFLKLWPIAHRDVRRDAEGRPAAGEWSVLSPIPWRDNNALGFEEAYGFLWELAAGRRRAVDDTSVDLFARLYSRRTRKQHTTMSVPFLFNYEQDQDGATLRLFQFLPIGLGGGERRP